MKTKDYSDTPTSPRRANMDGKPTETSKKLRISPRRFRKNMTPPTPWFQTFSLQNYETINFNYNSTHHKKKLRCKLNKIHFKNLYAEPGARL